MWDIIGKVTVFYIVARCCWSVWRGIYGSFIASILGLNLNLKNMRKWAVVTGATDGIGKAYAMEMARNGLNVVLISRTPYKLQNVAAEITSKYKVETKIIDVDFTQLDIYDRIAKDLLDLEIGVLVNNVGMSYEHPEYFGQLSEQHLKNLIVCNIFSLTMMTKIVLPGMQKRKNGLIINVSSLSSLIPAPLLTVYGATKAYVSNFSISLNMETKSEGIIVQCVTPGYVVSNMSKIRKATIMAPTPLSYVHSSLKTTGIENLTGGYFMHKLQIYAIEVANNYLPGFVLPNIVFGQLKAIRMKALKRREKEAKSN